MLVKLPEKKRKRKRKEKAYILNCARTTTRSNYQRPTEVGILIRFVVGSEECFVYLLRRNSRWGDGGILIHAHITASHVDKWQDQKKKKMINFLIFFSVYLCSKITTVHIYRFNIFARNIFQSEAQLRF